MTKNYKDPFNGTKLIDVSHRYLGEDDYSLGRDGNYIVLYRHGKEVGRVEDRDTDTHDAYTLEKDQSGEHIILKKNGTAVSTIEDKDTAGGGSDINSFEDIPYRRSGGKPITLYGKMSNAIVLNTVGITDQCGSDSEYTYVPLFMFRSNPYGQSAENIGLRFRVRNYWDGEDVTGGTFNSYCGEFEVLLSAKHQAGKNVMVCTEFHSGNAAVTDYDDFSVTRKGLYYIVWRRLRRRHAWSNVFELLYLRHGDIAVDDTGAVDQDTVSIFINGQYPTRLGRTGAAERDIVSLQSLALGDDTLTRMSGSGCFLISSSQYDSKDQGTGHENAFFDNIFTPVMASCYAGGSSSDSYTLQKSGSSIQLLKNGTVQDTVVDTDTDTTYTLSLSGTTLTLTPSDGGPAQSITLPSGGGDSYTLQKSGSSIQLLKNGTVQDSVVDTDSLYGVVVDPNNHQLLISRTYTKNDGTSEIINTTGIRFVVSNNNLFLYDSSGNHVQVFTNSNTTYTLGINGTTLTLTSSDDPSHPQTVTLPSGGGDSYTLQKSGSSIQLLKNGTVQDSVTDSDTNTTYTLYLDGNKLCLSDSNGAEQVVFLGEMGAGPNYLLVPASYSDPGNPGTTVTTWNDLRLGPALKVLEKGGVRYAYLIDAKAFLPVGLRDDCVCIPKGYGAYVADLAQKAASGDPFLNQNLVSGLSGFNALLSIAYDQGDTRATAPTAGTENLIIFKRHLLYDGYTQLDHNQDCVLVTDEMADILDQEFDFDTSAWVNDWPNWQWTDGNASGTIYLIPVQEIINIFADL